MNFPPSLSPSVANGMAMVLPPFQPCSIEIGFTLRADFDGASSSLGLVGLGFTTSYDGPYPAAFSDGPGVTITKGGRITGGSNTANFVDSGVVMSSAAQVVLKVDWAPGILTPYINGVAYPLSVAIDGDTQNVSEPVSGASACVLVYAASGSGDIVASIDYVEIIGGPPTVLPFWTSFVGSREIP